MVNARFVLLVLVALTLAAIGLLRRPALERELQATLQAGADARWVAMATEVMAKFSARSKEVSSWSVNTPDQNSAIAVYLFDSARARATDLKAFRHNCRYLGDGRRIVCDAALFRDLVHRYALDQREEVALGADGNITRRYLVDEDEETVSKHHKAMMTWVFGHEIGHLVRKHLGPAYFEQHSFEESMPAANYCHRMELEADAFLISSFPPEKGSLDDLYMFIYALVNREIKRQVCPDQSLAGYCNKILPGTGMNISPKPLGYSDSNAHPDYIIRLLRILEAIQEREDFGILAYQARQLLHTGLVKMPSLDKYREPCKVR